MIKIGTYIWPSNIPVPKCDSCNKKDAEHKIYTEKNGIRLCGDCLETFKQKISEYE